MNQQQILTWLPVMSAVSAVISAIVMWGFATGRWAKNQEVTNEKVIRNEQALRKEAQARITLAESLNVTLGRLKTEVDGTMVKLQNQVNLLDQGFDLRGDHLDRVFRDVIERLGRLEGMVGSLQRQVDRRDRDRSHSE